MFFMMGITDGRKDFDFNQVITCSLFRVLNGTGTTTCRPHAVMHFTSLIRK